MSIIRIRDENGNMQEILVLKGEKGDKGNLPDVDDALSLESENPVQNKVVTQAIGNIETALDNKVNQDLFNGVVLNLFDEISEKADASSLEGKADLSDLQIKMDKVMGTDTQYAGFDGIAPQVRAITPDTKPTENSTKLITSGGVYSALGDVESALDSIIAMQEELIGGDA